MEILDPSEGEENCINFKRNDNGEIDFYMDARGTEPEPLNRWRNVDERLKSQINGI